MKLAVVAVIETTVVGTELVTVETTVDPPDVTVESTIDESVETVLTVAVTVETAIVEVVLVVDDVLDVGATTSRDRIQYTSCVIACV